MVKYVNELIERYPILKDNKKEILDAYALMEKGFAKNGKLLIAGNGGSAADAEHIAGELMKSFKKPRQIPEKLAQRLKKVDKSYGRILSKNIEMGLLTIPLITDNALATAYTNDVTGECVFAQKLCGYGKKGDVFLAISTSGNSRNVVLAAVMAKALGMKVIGLTGASGGKLKKFSDVCICVPETETYKVQELHLPIYHCICLMLEDRFFGER